MIKPIKKLEPQDADMLFKVIFDILERGNDAEINSSENGINVFEVSKTTRVEIKNNMRSEKESKNGFEF